MITVNYETLNSYIDLFSNRVIKASRFLEERFPEQTSYDFRRNVDFHEVLILMEEGLGIDFYMRLNFLWDIR